MKRVISLILSIAMVASLCAGLAITGFAAFEDTDKYYNEYEDEYEGPYLYIEYDDGYYLWSTKETPESTIQGLEVAYDNNTYIISVTDSIQFKNIECDSMGYGVPKPDLVINIDSGKKLTVASTKDYTHSILGNGTLTINGPGTLEASRLRSDFNAIHGANGIIISNNCKIKAESAGSDCIYAQGDIIISEDSYVEARGGNAALKVEGEQHAIKFGLNEITEADIKNGEIKKPQPPLTTITVKDGSKNGGYVSIGTKPAGPNPEELFKYTTDSDSATIKGFKQGVDVPANLVIPDTLGGKPVTSIGTYAFQNCTSLTNVTIPDSVITVSNYAFNNCKGLTDITIGENVTSIGSSAFYKCTSLTNVIIPNSVKSIKDAAFRECTGLTNVTIGSGVTSIDYYAFYGCTGLTEITIPNNVTSIGSSAFQNCTGLTEITIPNNVTSINQYLFSGCLELKSVTIGSGVTSINNNAFDGCNVLTDINIDAGNTFYTFTDGVLYSKINEEPKELVRCLISKTGAFTIPNSVTTISDVAFRNCTGLTSVTFGENVESIGQQAFYGCSNLTNIAMSSSVISIGVEAFKDCLSLTNVTIPNNVTSIGRQAFVGCTSLTEVIVGNENTVYSSADGVVYSKDGTKLICCPEGRVGSFTIPEGVGIIENYAFNNCIGLTNVIIPNSVITISNCAFKSCKGLTDIRIGENVTNIGEEAFSYCTGLTSVTIPNNVTSIGRIAFADCTGLTSVTIGNGVKSIVNYAFTRDANLTAVYISAINPPTLGTGVFNGCHSELKIYVPEGKVGAYEGATNWASYAGKIFEIPASAELSFDGTGKTITVSGVDKFTYSTDGNTFSAEVDSLVIEPGNFYTISSTNGMVYINYVIKNIEISVDKDTLQGYINTSENVLNAVSPTNNNLEVIGNTADNKLYVPQAAYDKFNSDITTAEAVYGKTSPEATQFELDKALIDLRKAETEFVKAIRVNNLYSTDNTTITCTNAEIKFGQNDVITSQVIGTMIAEVTGERAVTTISIDGISSTYYSYVAESDIEKYVAADEANKPIPGGTTGGGATGGKYDGMPLELSTSLDKITFTKDDNNFTIKGIYYGLGTKDTILEKDYFGVNLGSDSVYALGNGTHTFRILAISKNGDVNEYYETIEVTGIDTQVVVKQCGVVYINFNGKTTSEIKYTKGLDTVYIPVEDKIKLDAAKFDGVSTITFDTTPVAIK